MIPSVDSDFTDEELQDLAELLGGFGEVLEMHVMLSIWFSGAVIPAASC